MNGWHLVDSKIFILAALKQFAENSSSTNGVTQIFETLFLHRITLVNILSSMTMFFVPRSSFSECVYKVLSINDGRLKREKTKMNSLTSTTNITINPRRKECDIERKWRKLQLFVLFRLKNHLKPDINSFQRKLRQHTATYPL